MAGRGGSGIIRDQGCKGRPFEASDVGACLHHGSARAREAGTPLSRHVDGDLLGVIGVFYADSYHDREDNHLRHDNDTGSLHLARPARLCTKHTNHAVGSGLGQTLRAGESYIVLVGDC